MVTLGSSHVVLSLALVGLEIYTLIPGSSTDAPSLQVSFHRAQLRVFNFIFTLFYLTKFAQFTHAIASAGCLWSELCVKEYVIEERTGDIDVLLAVHDK